MQHTQYAILQSSVKLPVLTKKGEQNIKNRLAAAKAAKISTARGSLAFHYFLLGYDNVTNVDGKTRNNKAYIAGLEAFKNK